MSLLEGELDDVGRQACLDGAALLAGSAVGLLELDAFPLRGLLEGGNDLVVGLLRRRVGDERQVAAGRPLACSAARTPTAGGHEYD